MTIATILITTPLILQAGYDPVWFGILLVLLIQTVMVTPPFGIRGPLMIADIYSDGVHEKLG